MAQFLAGANTTASLTVEPASAPVKPATAAERPAVDFAFVREHVTMTQVLEHLGLIGQLRGRGQQRRCTCPVHGQPTDSSRTFSVHLFKNVFRCFHAECGVQGNVLDLWAAIHRLPLYEAALHLAETFGLPRNREEEPVKGIRRPATGQTRSSKAAATSGKKRGGLSQ
jgi:DNA primase